MKFSNPFCAAIISIGKMCFLTLEEASRGSAKGVVIGIAAAAIAIAAIFITVFRKKKLK